MRHLALAVALKLMVLLALWWFFVRDQRVSPDAADVAAQWMNQSTPTGGASHPHPKE